MRTTGKLFFLLLIALFIFNVFTANTVFAQSGEPDSTFSKDGQVIFKGNGSASTAGIVAQPDGKIITAGTLTDTDSKVIAIRCHVNGRLDKSFGSNGLDTLFIFSGQNARVAGIALTPNNKIIIAGSALADSVNSKGIIVYQLNQDGSLDSSFNNDGKIFTSLHTTHTFSIAGVAIQPDGKIIVSGTISVQTVGKWISTFLIVRYNADGSLDTTFNHTGISYVNTPVLQTSNTGIKLLQNGKIVLFGGCNFQGLSSPPDGVVARYNSNGTLDSSFGKDGFSYYPPIGYYNFWIYCLEEQPDGKLIAGGLGLADGGATLSRLTPDGSIDSSFGKNGFAGISYDSGWSNYAFAMYVESDGKIIVGGESNNGKIQKFGVARLKTNGSADSSFGKNNDGTTSNFIKNNLSGGARSVCVADDRIYLAGFEFNGYINNQKNYGIAVAAYLRNDNILPVKLLSFTGQKQSNAALLQWQTVDEINNSYFNIERSADSKRFSLIGNKQASNDALGSNYLFADDAPLTGVNYYRLKQVDKDGKFTYSNIVSVDFSGNASVFTVYPNPAHDVLNITLPSILNTSEIVLYDLNGKKVFHEQLASSTISKQLNISKLSPGVYNVALIQNGKQQTVKTVKK